MSLITTNLLLDLLGLFLASAASIYFYYRWVYGHWKRRGIPYIEPSFPFGNFENPVKRKRAIGYLFKDLHDELKAKGHKYGGIYTFAKPSLLIIDPEIVRSILTKNFQHFTDRGLYYNEKIDPLSGHLFLLGGIKWRNLRIKLSPTFTSGKMKMMFAIMAECSNQLVGKVEHHAKEHTPVDIKETLACFTTDVIGSCAFGLECNSFKDEDSAFRKYGKKLFNPTPAQVAKTAFVFSFPKLANFFNIKQMTTDTENFYINMVKDTVQYREKTKFTRNDFMQLLINLKNEEGNGNNLTINEIAAQAFVFFIAGFETSSTAMTFCLYELANHPDIQEKVREEVIHVLKQHKGVVSYEAIQDMKYLAQVLDETLRKYPPLPVLHRKCTKECTIDEADLTIKREEQTIISSLALHYDPEYFPDPEKFDPERFSEANKANIKPFTYLPFGDGPRNCIGLRFGLMQSKMGLAVLLKNYEFSPNAKTQTPLKFFAQTLILSTKDPIYLNVKKID